MVRRSLLSLIDQSAWALTNFVAVALAARSLSAEAFGVFSLSFSAVILVSGVTLALGPETLGVTRGLLLREGRSTSEVVASTARSMALTVVGMVTGLIIVAAFALGATSRLDNIAVIWWVVPAAPLVIIADNLRATNYALRRVHSAAVCTASWIIAQGAVLVVLVLRSGSLTGTAALASWGAGAGACAAAGVLTVRVAPRFGTSLPGEWPRRLSYTVEYLATAAPPQLLPIIAAGPLGIVSAGTIRALQTIFGPLNVILLGLRNVVVPALAEEFARHRALRAGMTVSILSCAATLGLTAILASVPEIGRVIMGQNWSADSSLVLAYGLGRVAASAAFGAIIVYRTSDLYRLSVFLRLVSAAGLLVPFALLLREGLTMAFWASSIASLIIAALWWVIGPARLRSLDRKTPAIPRAAE